MAIIENIKVGDVYICPHIWNHCIGNTDHCHLVQIIKFNGTPQCIWEAQVLTKCSRVYTEGSLKLTRYNAMELIEIDSINQLIKGVFGL